MIFINFVDFVHVWDVEEIPSMIKLVHLKKFLDPSLFLQTSDQGTSGLFLKLRLQSAYAYLPHGHKGTYHFIKSVSYGHCLLI